jgi:hypothetical protein
VRDFAGIGMVEVLIFPGSLLDVGESLWASRRSSADVGYIG